MPLDPEQLAKPLSKIRKLLKKMPTIPTPDDVHSFRTNSRRIEITSSAVSLDSTNKGKRILKRLSRLRKRAGKVRDMDVLTDFASGIPHNGEKECSVQLLEHLGSERHKCAIKFHRVQRRYAPALRKGLKRAERKFEKAASSANDEKAARGLVAEIEASALRLLPTLAQPARLNRKNLHPYRLKVKELRNLLRLSTRSNQEEFVRVLGNVKDAIGEWHDWIPGR